MAEELHVIDPYTIPIEDLRQKTAEQMEKPRDDQGRFVKVDHGDELGAPPVEAAAEVPPVAEEPEEQVIIVRREIDLGDGSGVQVFKGIGKSLAEATDDFADKLTEAQRNASKKIREEVAKRRELEAKLNQNSQDDDYVINQKYKENPAEAMREVLRKEREQQDRQKAEEAAVLQRSLKAQEDFVAAHPEYVVNAANGNRLSAWIRTHGYSEFTEESLEKAFNDLSESGLLVLKTEEADGTTAAEGKEPERIAQPAPEATQPRGRRSSTVRGGAPPTVRTGLTEAELERLPMEELARKTREAFMQGQE